MENQSVGEYVTSLKNRISIAFDLVWRSVSQHHVYQKKLYDQKSGVAAVGRGGSCKLPMEGTLHCDEDDF